MNRQALAALIGPAARAITHAFDCMGVAEREIARAKLTKPQGSAVFRIAYPSAPILDKSIDVYRAHVRELIARVKAGSDTRPATDAELLALFCDTSLKAPLHRNAQAAVEVLWARVFPTGQIGGEVVTETWPHGAAEEIAKARKKFTQHERR